MWIRYNPNPCGKRVGDCTIRAISKALNQSWGKTYWQMSIFGYLHCDLLNSNNLWTYFLKEKGFKMRIILDEYPDYYTVDDFCTDQKFSPVIFPIQNRNTYTRLIKQIPQTDPTINNFNNEV